MSSSVPLPGTLYIISAPSCAGKTSLVGALLKQTESIAVSTSHTTRPMRPGEENGVHYHFVDVTTFNNLKDAGEFMEFASVFDNFYGTSKSSVTQSLATGTDIILEIDWQGAQQVRKVFPDAVGIFILPPSKAALRERLTGRGQDDESVIQRRLRDAETDMSHFAEFEYLVVNEVFEDALLDLKTIVKNQRLQGERQARKYASLIAELLA